MITAAQPFSRYYPGRGFFNIFQVLSWSGLFQHFEVLFWSEIFWHLGIILAGDNSAFLLVRLLAQCLSNGRNDVLGVFRTYLLFVGTQSYLY